ncbi:MAG TPA: hypothetical protein VEK15_21430 [Vicinamibacteria bacterium]|nr:hypothetical protein [Vicinamibacteria bacterium]
MVDHSCGRRGHEDPGVHPARAGSRQAAESAFRNGALWNTAILVGKVQSFWRLGWRHLPQMMVPFVELWESLGTENESAVLERIYRTLPTLDLSRDLLQASTANLVVSKLSNLLWSDWGSPARIRETLEVIGARERASEALETLHLSVEEA